MIELLFGVFGKFIDANGFKSFNSFLVGTIFAIAGNHRELFVVSDSCLDLLLQGDSHAIHFIKCIGEMSGLYGFIAAIKSLKYGLAELSVLPEVREGN